MATLYAGVGGYSIIGSASANQFTLGVDAGSYAITGSTAVLRGSLHQGILADKGTYTYTGTVVLFTRLQTEPGAYLISGKVATLTKISIKRLDVASGSYTYTGNTGSTLEHAVPSIRGIYSITGTAATVSKDTVIKTITVASGSYTYTAGTAILQHEVPMESGDYQISGTAATLRIGWTLFANTGSYVWLGATTTKTEHTTLFSAAPGTYTYTGFDQGLIWSGDPFHRLIAEVGQYAYTGTPNVFQRKVTAESGSYTITGSEASLFQAVSGIYAISGTAVAFIHDSKLIATSGTYTYTGSSVNAGQVKNFPVDSGSYIIFGFPATFPTGRFITAASGTYTYTGTEASLFATHIVLDSGVYEYFGTPANLIPSRVGRWRKQPPRPPRFTKQAPNTSTWEPQPTGPGVL